MSQKEVGRSVSDPLKVHYVDDPDPEKAGQGLAVAPNIHAILDQRDLSYWMMSPAEQMAMVYLMDHVQPRVAIEIGTRFGGSLQVLARYCERVFSLDTDPEVPRRLAGRYNNVEYITGPSTQTLPALLERLSAENAPIGFILVDGDHSAAGVKADIDHILEYKPVVPLYVLMHDSFNPECRKGLVESRWQDCPYVHVVELDFVPGVVNPSPSFRDELWGGLALGILYPEKRQGRMDVIGRAERTFELTRGSSPRPSLVTRLRAKVRRIIR